MTSSVEVLCFEKCLHGDETLRLTRKVASRLMPEVPVERILVESEEEARRLSFFGSPTVRINGVDIEGRIRGVPGLRCRQYPSAGDMPAQWMIEAGFLRALRPAHLAFLCLANAARSQMAEGIARSLAPEGVAVSSAGSRPTLVRAEAVAVLEEIGLDISGQRSKGIADLDIAALEAVVTLCDEDVCPTLPAEVPRVHWPLPDPAAATGDEEERRQAFRAARDELRQRLNVLFAAWKP